MRNIEKVEESVGERRGKRDVRQVRRDGCGERGRKDEGKGEKRGM